MVVLLAWCLCYLLLLLSLSPLYRVFTLCPRDKPCPWGIHCCSYSFVLLSIRCMVHISLVPTLVLTVFYVSTFRRMCAVPNVAVFCSSRTSWLPGMLPTYFLNDLEMAPVAPIITGITVVFTFHIRWISIVRSLYFKFFSASFLITLLSPEMATPLLLLLLLLLCNCVYSCNMTLPCPWRTLNDVNTCCSGLICTDFVHFLFLGKHKKCKI